MKKTHIPTHRVTFSQSSTSCFLSVKGTASFTCGSLLSMYIHTYILGVGGMSVGRSCPCIYIRNGCHASCTVSQWIYPSIHPPNPQQTSTPPHKHQPTPTRTHPPSSTISGSGGGGVCTPASFTLPFPPPPPFLLPPLLPPLLLAPAIDDAPPPPAPCSCSWAEPEAAALAEEGRFLAACFISLSCCWSLRFAGVSCFVVVCRRDGVCVGGWVGVRGGVPSGWCGWVVGWGPLRIMNGRAD